MRTCVWCVCMCKWPKGSHVNTEHVQYNLEKKLNGSFKIHRTQCFGAPSKSSFIFTKQKTKRQRTAHTQLGCVWTLLCIFRACFHFSYITSMYFVICVLNGPLGRLYKAYIQYMFVQCIKTHSLSLPIHNRTFHFIMSVLTVHIIIIKAFFDCDSVSAKNQRHPTTPTVVILSVCNYCNFCSMCVSVCVREN